MKKSKSSGVIGTTGHQIPLSDGKDHKARLVDQYGCTLSVLSSNSRVNVRVWIVVAMLPWVETVSWHIEYIHILHKQTHNGSARLGMFHQALVCSGPLARSARLLSYGDQRLYGGHKTPPCPSPDSDYHCEDSFHFKACLFLEKACRPHCF